MSDIEYSNNLKDLSETYDTIQEAFRNRMSNTDEKGKYKHVYASKPKGKFYNIRTILSYVYLLLFVGLPFIKVNGQPFILLNFPAGKFILFSKVFWPQDFFIFAIGMIAAIIFIALFTVIFGRLFCGWICPQTIFMEMFFRKIEWVIEGTPAEQKRLNAAPWTGKKIFKKTLKHVVFFLFSFIIANTFLAYIVGVDELYDMSKHPAANIGTLVALLAFTGVFYAVFAFVRDIVCTTICPYGRLQSVLFDKDTMQVAYDYKRGEPRGKVKKREENNLGDCIDCNRCVVVCPTGIDIRNGVQMECVGCTACIDACDEMMIKVNRPTGLIRYASENEIADKKKFHLNFKVKGYSFILLLLLGVMTYLIASGKSIDTNITRAQGQLYTEQPDGKITNLYNAKIINKTNKPQSYKMKVEGIDAEVKMVTDDKALLKPEAINEVTFFINIDKSKLRERKTDLLVGVYNDGELVETVKTTFLGPFK